MTINRNDVSDGVWNAALEIAVERTLADAAWRAAELECAGYHAAVVDLVDASLTGDAAAIKRASDALWTLLKRAATEQAPDRDDWEDLLVHFDNEAAREAA